MTRFEKLVREQVAKLISENTEVNYTTDDGKTFQFNMTLDANEDKTKKGIKVKFSPVNPSLLTQDQHSELQIKLKDKLNQGLEQVGMSVDVDSELTDPQVIGFMINIEYLDKIIQDALKS